MEYACVVPSCTCIIPQRREVWFCLRKGSREPRAVVVLDIAYLNGTMVPTGRASGSNPSDRRTPLYCFYFFFFNVPYCFPFLVSLMCCLGFFFRLFSHVPPPSPPFFPYCFLSFLFFLLFCPCFVFVYVSHETTFFLWET